MNVRDLNRHFSESSIFNAKVCQDLELLVSKYPYFQPAWMLLAKAKYKNQSADYHDVLGQAAARVFDRAQLYQFIYDPSSDHESVAENLEPSKGKENAPFEEVKTAKAQNLEIEPKVQEKVAPLNSTEEEKQGKIQSKEDLRSIVKRRLEAIDEEKESVKESAAQEEVVESITPEESSIPKKRFKVDIIESFIKENPGINKPRDDEYIEEIEFAKKGLEERYDFVSETLAEINLKQGHKEKALKIYKQLILKYPEKSSYFAAQIKKVESKSNK